MASEIASSSLTGRPPISGISPSRPGRWPMVRWNAASAMRTCASACTRSARAPLEARLGLRHVGDREFADAEAFARGVELLDQHRHVVAARIGDGDVLHQVGVGR